MGKFPEWITVTTHINNKRQNTRLLNSRNGTSAHATFSALTADDFTGSVGALPLHKPTKAVSARMLLQQHRSCGAAGGADNNNNNNVSTTTSALPSAIPSRAVSEANSIMSASMRQNLQNNSSSNGNSLVGTQQQQPQQINTSGFCSQLNASHVGIDQRSNNSTPQKQQLLSPQKLEGGGEVRLMDAESAFQHSCRLAQELPPIPNAGSSASATAAPTTGFSPLSSLGTFSVQTASAAGAPAVPRVLGFASLNSRNALAAALVATHRVLGSASSGITMMNQSQQLQNAPCFPPPVKSEVKLEKDSMITMSCHRNIKESIQNKVPKSRILILSPSPCSVIAESIVATGLPGSRARLFQRIDFVPCCSAVKALQILEALIAKDVAVKRQILLQQQQLQQQQQQQQHSGNSTSASLKSPSSTSTMFHSRQQKPASSSSCSSPVGAAAASSAAATTNTVPPPPNVEPLAPIAVIIDRIDHFEPLAHSMKPTAAMVTVAGSGSPAILTPAAITPTSGAAGASTVPTKSSAAGMAAAAAVTQHAVNSALPFERWGALRETLMRGLADVGAFCSVSVTATAFPSSNSLLPPNRHDGGGGGSSSNADGYDGCNGSIGHGSGRGYTSAHAVAAATAGNFGWSAPVPAPLLALTDTYLLIPAQL